MAVITRDGEVKHDPRLLDGSGTGRVDEITASFDELTRLFGRDDYAEEADPAWAIRVESPDDRPAAVVLLHSYKDTRPRAYRHSSFVFSLNARRDQQWAADTVKAVITANREES